MKEYIDREAALDIVTEWCPDDDGSVGKTGDLRDMLDELEAIPAADVVEVRHGRWMRIDYEICGHDYLCSACKYKNYMETHYCPNCGAKMDEGVEEEE